MGSAKAFAARRARVSEWYAPARFGLFYHWGSNTGGGSSEEGDYKAPFKYPTVEEFEAATGDPQTVGDNLIALAKSAGAKYVVWTLLHSCDKYLVKFPTTIPGFINKTTLDYAGALLDAGMREEIKVLFYIPTGGMPNPHLGPEIHDKPSYTSALRALVGEAINRYGSKIAGFWLDGWTDLEHDIPSFIRGALPHAIIVQNGPNSLSMTNLDFAAAEFARGTPDPAYNRPSAFFKSDPHGCLPMRNDFVEDIPTCNQWWHGSPYMTDEQLKNGPYASDPTFWVKEMLASLGQRGMWNYAHGLGPCIDGTVPPVFTPMIKKMGDFLAWAGEAVYGTTGGGNSAFCPGWCWKDGFVSVTVSLSDPRVHYLHVTTAPDTDCLILNTNGPDVLEVVDLRTGKPHPFLDRGCLEILGVEWDDVADYGAKVFKVTVDL